jgi:hypothetical protein
MYEMNIVYANRTETSRADTDIGELIEKAFSHQDGKERAKEIIVFNLSIPANYSKPTGTQPEPQPAP